MLTFLALAGALATQEPSEVPLAERVAAVESCVAAAEDEAERCVGVIDDPCQEAPLGGSTLGMLACLAAETEAWDALMTRWFEAARTSPDIEAPARQALETAQRDWRRGVDQSLRVYGGRQGTIWPVIAAGWRLEWTARRALWLKAISEGG